MRLRQLAVAGDILFAEASLFHEPKLLAELRIVAELGVGIQRQMVGQQADIVLQQMCNAALLDADDRRVFVAPEIAVMHQNGIRAPRGSGIQQALRGRYAGGDTEHLCFAFHLHSIRAIITKTVNLQQASDIITQFVQHHVVPNI